MNMIILLARVRLAGRFPEEDPTISALPRKRSHLSLPGRVCPGIGNAPARSDIQRCMGMWGKIAAAGKEKEKEKEKARR
jgi:hypothetical protein